MPKLSVIIICKNEALDIDACLQSIAWADEIIVFDSGSHDETVAICKRYTPHVFCTDWPGFGPQKNRALAKATGDWVLSLDADERVTPALCDEIQHCLKNNSAYSGFRIPFQTNYCGRFIQFGAWRGKMALRLVRRNCARFSNDAVHERLLVTGKISRLKTPLIHYSFHDLDEVLTKINRYSTDSAQMLYERGKKAHLGTALLHGFWTFIRSYCLKLGFLDGKEGFILALSNAQGSYYRYVKLMYLWELKNQI